MPLRRAMKSLLKEAIADADDRSGVPTGLVVNHDQTGTIANLVFDNLVDGGALDPVPGASKTAGTVRLGGHHRPSRPPRPGVSADLARRSGRISGSRRQRRRHQRSRLDPVGTPRRARAVSAIACGAGSARKENTKTRGVPHAGG